MISSVLGFIRHTRVDPPFQTAWPPLVLAALLVGGLVIGLTLALGVVISGGRAEIKAAKCKLRFKLRPLGYGIKRLNDAFVMIDEPDVYPHQVGLHAVKAPHFNPFGWLHSTQSWFTRAERSSGFRPYLVFLLVVSPLAVALMYFFQGNELVLKFALSLLAVSCGGFVVLFAVKSIQQPDFCRSEKHIENLQRLSVAGQKGERGQMIFTPETAEISENKPVPLIRAPEVPSAES